jgi:hypothetical protein
VQRHCPPRDWAAVSSDVRAAEASEDVEERVGAVEAGVIWTSLGPLPRWVPGPTTRWAPGTT